MAIMAAMQRAPFVISAALTAAALALVVHISVAPGPFAADSAAVLVVGLLMFVIITIVGMLLSRGCWARRLGFVVVTSELAIALAVDLGPWSVISIALNGLTLLGLSGPWLDGWIRGRPAAGGPSATAVILLLGTLALIPGVAVFAHQGLDGEHWALLGVAALGGWGYSRASGLALWLLRLAPVPLAILMAAGSRLAEGAYVVVHASAVSVLAWSPDSLRAIRPILDRVYGPRKARELDKRARNQP